MSSKFMTVSVVVVQFAFLNLNQHLVMFQIIKDSFINIINIVVWFLMFIILVVIVLMKNINIITNVVLSIMFTPITVTVPINK